MIEPRFKTGDLVRVECIPPPGVNPLTSMMARDGTTGLFEVTAVFPEAVGWSKYQIKRGDGTPERIVRESQLISAIRVAAPRY
jgi:hypothetical protein